VKEEFKFFGKDETELVGLICRPQKFRGLAVVFAHGIPAGSPPAPDDTGYLELCERASELGYVAATMNFRGTGKSGGNFDIAAWVDDLKVFLDILWKMMEPKGIVLVGSSGGAAVSVKVASEETRVIAIALLACPADFSFFAPWKEPEQCIQYFRGIGIIRDADFPKDAQLWAESFKNLAPEGIIGSLHMPILLIHGTGDEVVPFEHAKRLKSMAQSARLIPLDKFDHRLRHYPAVKALIVEWLRSIIVKSEKDST